MPKRNFAFVGSDGETAMFVSAGFAYYLSCFDDFYGLHIPRDEWGTPQPVADFDCHYSVARVEFGSDHLRAEHLMPSHFRELCDPIQWVLYPGQLAAWTLPAEQEC